MYTILIIDDDSRILHLAKIALEMFTNWKTLVAASGKEGLTGARKEKPDAIPLDVRMPGMNGLETLGYLRDHPVTGSIPVILFTSITDERELAEFTRLSIAGIISKPFDLHDLAPKIRALLDWRE
jgi:CheY-like chemotaxis protein